MRTKRRQWFTGTHKKKSLDNITSGLLFTYSGNEKAALLEANDLIDIVLAGKEREERVQKEVRNEKSNEAEGSSASTVASSVTFAEVCSEYSIENGDNAHVKTRKRIASESGDEDVADSVKRFCNQEKNARNFANKTSKQVWSVNLGVKCCLFMAVDSRVIGPYCLVDEIYNLMLKGPHCRKLQRVLPVETTCPLHLTTFNEEMIKLVLRHFVRNSEGKWPTYSVEIFRRNNNDMSRENILTVIDDTVSQLAPLCKVNLRNPDVTVLVQISGNYHLVNERLVYAVSYGINE